MWRAFPPAKALKSLGFEKIDDVDVTNLVPQEQEKEHSAALIRGVAAGIVNAGGKVYQVSNKVVCYNTTTKVWFTGDDPLYQIRAYSDDLTIYVDPYGEKVRVITTQ